MLLHGENRLCEEMSLGLLSTGTLTKLNCFMFRGSGFYFE